MFGCARICVHTPLQVDDEGELFYSLDDCQTRFSDLIQLVEFYQLNRGVLPFKLKHHCARITLWTRDPRDPRGPTCTLTPGPLWTCTPSVLVPWRRNRTNSHANWNHCYHALSSPIILCYVIPPYFVFQKKLNLTIDCMITDYMCCIWCAVLSKHDLLCCVLWAERVLQTACDSNNIITPVEESIITHLHTVACIWVFAEEMSI